MRLVFCSPLKGARSVWEEWKALFAFSLKQLMNENCLEVKPQRRAKCFASYERSLQRSTPARRRGLAFPRLTL